MRTELFDYDLPEELIAQAPLPRGKSRLLVVHRSTGKIEHRTFADLPNYLVSSDTLVLNDTRVTGRRLEARRENGLAAEVLLIAPVGESGWRALVRPGRALRIGRKVTLVGPDSEVCASVVSEAEDGSKLIELPDRLLSDRIATWGHTPTPPYIHQPLSRSDEERYQTVYSRKGGSTAAPTAGLHFTDQLLTRIDSMGVRRTAITLHIGIGTFRPVRTVDIGDHKMHGEFVTVSAETADVINSADGRIVAVGTTTVRALESAASMEINPPASVVNPDVSPERVQRLRPFRGETNLFITPGSEFGVVDALITNFHQPKSTLLMMVSAFAGIELVRNAYMEAIEQRYRFFSFGDAMLIT